MNLQSVAIRHFRSIEAIELQNCGPFNVLIGKNNSGKSNILTAISAFFHCIRGGNIGTLDPSIGQEIDFHNRETTKPIEITLAFALAVAERDQLVAAIANEAPQMRNAVEGLDLSFWLYATVAITPPPQQFGYVSRLAFAPAGCSPEPSGQLLGKEILSTPQEAASELYSKLTTARQHSRDADALQVFLRNFDSDDWRRINAEGASRQLLRGMFFRPAAMSSEVSQRVASIQTESSSFEEFSSSVTGLERNLRETARQAQTTALRSRIGTFAGEQEMIPHYVTSLLEIMAGIKVLYLLTST